MFNKFSVYKTYYIFKFTTFVVNRKDTFAHCKNIEAKTYAL